MVNALGVRPKIVVGISDVAVTNYPDIVINTYALGSCIGLVAHDPFAPAAGLIHFMLADSSNQSANAANKPYMFADTGLPLFLRDLYGMGARRDRLVFAMAGGCSTNGGSDFFKIGEKNIRATEAFLQREGLRLKVRDVGGTQNRTLSFYTVNSILAIKSPTGTVEHLLR